MSDHPVLSAEDMQKRVVRFDHLKTMGIPIMFIDSVLPGHQRMNYAIIGDTASENPDFTAQRAITAPHKFQIGMGWSPPGSGPAWHTHDYVEAFFVLEGEWRFVWGYDPDPAKPEGEFILGKWDLISFPPGVWRRFEVSGASIGWFFAILDPHEVFTGKDPIWPPTVVQQAQAAGFYADESGKMVKPADYDAINAAQRDELLAKFNTLVGVPLAQFHPDKQPE